MSTGDERVYFDDEYFLVTSKRIVDRANGKTIPVKEISSAEVEFAPLRDRDPTDRLFEWIFSVFGMRIGRERFGEIRIVVLVSGKRVTMLEARISWNTKDDYPRLVGELGSFSMASKWKEVVAYCQNLAISVGAASVGA